jgi:hypothetical protein
LKSALSNIVGVFFDLQQAGASKEANGKTVFNSSIFIVSVNENHSSKHGMVYRFYRKE